MSDQESFVLPTVIGHRGACAYAPENTMASFYKAYELGCQWVEFDVKLTKDNQAIIFHDDNLERTSNVCADVQEFTLSELLQFDVGSWFAPEFADERIATFETVIEFLKKHRMNANVEIKPVPGFEIITAEKTMQMIKDLWPADTEPLISSFKFVSLQKARECDTNAKLGLLMKESSIAWASMAKEINCYSVHVSEKILDQPLITRIKDQGYKLLSFTVNDVDRARELLSMGVDAVFSDYPDRIMFGVR